ncbi:hypothetical protein GI374_17815 [Paracoccus sp. S-4012]|uniref:hypothetical protein n=1 Tax=Paracoccus sp. S-4012 TaxID=2665648 RepID=UPI0012B0C957|nr:hypothetical protein [Paracoccus sp. S-4012]MRX52214.1 hypothetical protein [Paracoccus sp. S-4012]
MRLKTNSIPRLRRAAASLIVAACLAAPALAQATDHLGLPGPIEFDGESFALAWTLRPSEHYVKQEYVPDGQSVESYERMLLVETVAGGLGVMDAVRAQTDMLAQRRPDDPLVNMDVIQNEATGEALLDFIVSSKDADGEYIVEWNAYRYARHTDAANDAGVMLFGVSHRAYGNADSQAFLQGLPALRSSQIDALARASLPSLAD